MAAPGIDVNQAKNTGSTPLYVAAQNGVMAIVKVHSLTKVLTVSLDSCRRGKS